MTASPPRSSGARWPPHNGYMSQPVRVVVASVLAAIGVGALVVVASQIDVTYYLPPGDSGMATKHVSAFKPAVAATVVASLAVTTLLVHLVLVIRRRTAPWTWFTAAGCALLAAGAPVIVATLDRPVF